MSRSGATIVAMLLVLVACTVRPGPSNPAGLGDSSPPRHSSLTPRSTEVAVDCPEIPRTAPSLPALPADVDEATRAAIADRIEYGLQFDLEWVREVAAAPQVDMAFGFPILPEEAESLMARNGLADPVQAALRRLDLDEEIGGIYTDHSLGGVVVVTWPGDPAPVEAAVRDLLPDCYPVLVRSATWSEAELRAWQDRISGDTAWMAEIPAVAMSVGVDVFDNVVTLGISSAEPAAEAMILDHYDAPPGMIRVESDGTGAAMLPVGTVVGRVLDADGSPPDTGSLLLGFGSPTDPPGGCGGGDIGYGVLADGTFEYPCQVGRRTIHISAPGADGEHHRLASAIVDVPANGLVEVEMTLPDGFDPG